MRTTDTAPGRKQKALSLFPRGRVDRPMGLPPLLAAALLLAACHRTPLGFISQLGDAGGATLGRDAAPPIPDAALPIAAPDLAAAVDLTTAPDLGGPPDVTPPPDLAIDLAPPIA